MGARGQELHQSVGKLNSVSIFLLLPLLIRDGPTVVRVVDDADDGNLCQDAEKDRL